MGIWTRSCFSVILLSVLLSVLPAAAEEEGPVSLEELLAPPPEPTEEADLWIGGEGAVVFHPMFMPGARFDLGVGHRKDRGLIAGNLKVGYSHPAWITVDALFVVGGTTPRRPSQPFYALQVGGGLTFDAPSYALRPSSVPEEWTKRAASPSVVIGGSFGMFVGGMSRQRQFRVALEPRFRGVVTVFEEGSKFMPGVELSLCLGADLI
jgi:hypothetical protein